MGEIEPSGGLETITALERLGAATATSLDLPPDMSYDRYEALGVALSTAKERITWWIADWINFGERVYGEMYAQAAHVTGLSEDTLMTYASVARRVPRDRRTPELKFGHHAEVSSLPPEEQVFWLHEAVEHHWKRDELRAQVRPLKNLPPAAEVVAAGLEEAARDLVRSAKRYGNDFLVGRPSFVQLCHALGEEV